eukprot:GILK01006265.1.p1 GENE.GILK01006265.1~~GILK01006265.1.p1  ORF type:complete len:308 (+),score=21.65 GILK01006265.1:40-963(+)
MMSQSVVDRLMSNLDAPPELESKQDESLENTTSTCRPWSVEDYQRRLSTFKVWLWFGKPLWASPCQCARHGYICSGVDEIQCSTCKQSMRTPKVVTSRDESKEDFYESLKSLHLAYCPWKENVCSRDVMLPDITNPAALLEKHKDRMAGLQQLPSLPTVDKNCIADLGSIRNIIPSTDDRSISAFLLALFNWSVCPLSLKESNDGYVLECRQCQRRVGSWNLTSKPFHPLAEHRNYCLWVNQQPIDCDDASVTSTTPAPIGFSQVSSRAAPWQHLASALSSRGSAGNTSSFALKDADLVSVVRKWLP